MSEFRWRASRDGYRWSDQSESANLTTTFADGYREYDPMRCTSLFLEFAQLGEDRDAYLRFAESYGHLTSGVSVVDADETVALEQVGPTCPVPAGASTVDADRRRKSASELALLQWPNGPYAPYGPRPGTGLDRGYETVAVWQANVNEMNRLMMQSLRWQRRHRKVTRIKWGREILAPLRDRVIPDFDNSGALVMGPTDLLSALWLQFARAVTGGKQFRLCEHCFQCFVVSEQAVGASRAIRNDKRFCQDRCRMADAYQKRKAMAATNSKKATAARCRKGRAAETPREDDT